jgi:non-ribosomal peptide synthetase component E (peptide arylation enzyme)
MSDLPGKRPASRTLGDVLDEMAATAPNAEALVFCDERLGYAGLKALVDVFARALLAVGIRQRVRSSRRRSCCVPGR